MDTIPKRRQRVSPRHRFGIVFDSEAYGRRQRSNHSATFSSIVFFDDVLSLSVAPAAS